MSITLLGMDKNNKIWTDNIVAFRAEFACLLVSNLSDAIYLTDQDIIKGRRLLFNLKTINNFLPKGIVCKVGSAKRTNYINIKIGGSITTQHIPWEAMDLLFYKDGKRIKDRRVLYPFYSLIIELMGDLLQQIILYNTFIHVGLATSRAKITKRRFLK